MAAAAEDPYNLRIIARPVYNTGVRLITPGARVPDFEITPSPGQTTDRIDSPYRDDPDEFESSTPVREGLPPKFRMRHAPHYVEQLMGDAPLQTVRQVPIDSIDEVPIEDVKGPSVAAALDDLVASIREVGVLQPLLVAARDGSRFELLAGSHRLSAARQAGLAAVPCLVVNADVDAAMRFRAQAARHAVLESRATTGAASDDETAPALLRTAFAEITTSMRFVNSLAPNARTHDSGSRAAMVLDTIGVESHRAATMAAAGALLMRTDPLRLRPLDCAAVLETIRAEIKLVARLKGVDVAWTQSLALAKTVADREALVTGWSALIHAMLGAAREADQLTIALSTARVRPAIMLEVVLRGGSMNGSAEAFLDTDRRDHPAGQAGAMMLASARQSAQLHGGRLTVRAVDDGVAVSYVVPQPLDLQIRD